MNRIIYLYICRYTEKEPSLASRHIISSISTCSFICEKDIGENGLPEEIERSLRLKGEANIFDPRIASKFFGAKIDDTMYLKIKIVEKVKY